MNSGGWSISQEAREAWIQKAVVVGGGGGDTMDGDGDGDDQIIREELLFHLHGFF